MENVLRVLIVEDNPMDAELMVRRIVREGYKIDWQRVENEKEYREALREKSDLILSDWSLPGFSGLRALQIARELDLDVPFIIVSGSIGEESAVDALHQGAADYLLKDRLDRLGRAVRNALDQNRLYAENRKAEHLLRESEERFRIVAANAGEWIWEVDPDGLYRYSSPVVEKMLGYTPEELVGRIHFYDLFVPEERDLLGPLVLQIFARNEIIQGLVNVNLAKDGRRVILETSGVPILNDAGELTGYRGTDLDITARKQAEQDLLNSEQRYRFLVELSPDAIFINRNNRIDFVNPAAVELFGASAPEQLLGKSPFDLFHPDYHPIMRERIRLLVEKNESVELIEEKIVRLNGTIRDIEVTAAPFMDAEGRAIQVILRDITQRKLSEAQVQKANAEVLQAYDATLQGWSNALELREHETAGHSKRVVHYTLALARALNVDADELIHIQRGALLHDIGKIGIPDTILNKPGPLDDAEWTTMRQHPIYAYNLLSSISYLAPALVIPYGHHERWNGAGYPRGLAGEQIPLAARIFAVVDVWDALSYDRPYRSAWSKEKVIQYLKDQSGIQFDPRILIEFLRLIEET